MSLIDTHTHLFTNEFEADRLDAIQRAIKAGVTKFFLPNIDSSTILVMLTLEEQFSDICFPMIGLHPCSVNENYMQELSIIEEWLTKRKFCGIGEIGLDYYWDKTFIPQQKIAFAQQIDWAKRYSIPIVIHQRESFEDTFRIVQRKNDDTLSGIFHCFTGTIEQAEKIISLGNFLLGIGGVITYKKSTLPDVIEKIDLKHIVLETDSPYLPPVPYRGKRNESSYLPLIAQKIAEIKNISLEEVAQITTANATQIFKLE